MITREEFIKLEQERNERLGQRQKDCTTRLTDEVDRVIRENWAYAKMAKVVFEMKNFRFDEREIKTAMNEVNAILRKNGVNVNVMLNEGGMEMYPTVYFKVCK